MQTPLGMKGLSKDKIEKVRSSQLYQTEVKNYKHFQKNIIEELKNDIKNLRDDTKKQISTIQSKITYIESLHPGDGYICDVNLFSSNDDLTSNEEIIRGIIESSGNLQKLRNCMNITSRFWRFSHEDE
jgi:phosphoglycerate-specific signal transduction histidine kinase